MKHLFIFLWYLSFAGLSWGQQAFNNMGNLQFHSGADVSFYGNFSNSGTLTDNGNGVYFTGTAPQTIGGTSVTTFRNASVNNVSGLLLNQNLTISNRLDLTDGAVTLNSRILTLTSSASTAIARTNGFIVSEQTDNSGRLRWNIGSTTGHHEFPFATAAGIYIPFTVDLTAGNIGNVTLATYHTAADNTPYPTTPNAVTTMVDSSGMDNSLNTADRFWQIDKDGPSGTATLTFTATPAEMGVVQYQVKARRWNTATSSWDAPLPGQTATATSVTVPGVTAFSPWTVAWSVIPLPIELLVFTAQLNERREVDLNWATATEINNDYFTVERSRDLVTYEVVGTQPGAGNSNHPLSYSDVDLKPYAGISYYRLKQTDYDGSYKYFAPVSINLEGNAVFDVTVFPNPSDWDDTYAVISGISGETLTWQLETITGQRIWHFVQQTNGSESLQWKLPLPTLAGGIYLLNVSSGSNQKTVRLVVK